MPIGLWLVDDSEPHHHAARTTLAQVPGFALESFLGGEDAVAEFLLRAKTAPQELPRIILMDFYLGDGRGDEFTAAMRAADPPAFHPVIVGYSSVTERSRQIVAAGGDLTVRKRIARDGSNPDLRVYLESFLAIAGR